jgi:hypothetical protein
LYPRHSDTLPATHLSSFSAITDIFIGQNNWEPNSTLVLGGDTTILFYFIGGVHNGLSKVMTQFLLQIPSSNFSANMDTLYDPLFIVGAVLCDTQYQFCIDGGRDCSPVGGTSKVSKWIGSKVGNTWEDIFMFFIESMRLPPVMQHQWARERLTPQKPWPRGNHAASTLPTATIDRELRRLTQAGMLMLASGSQLAALGYWNLGVDRVGHTAS